MENDKRSSTLAQDVRSNCIPGLAYEERAPYMEEVIEATKALGLYERPETDGLLVHGRTLVEALDYLKERAGNSGNRRVLLTPGSFDLPKYSFNVYYQLYDLALHEWRTTYWAGMVFQTPRSEHDEYAGYSFHS